jgi:hypothetical protein
MKSFLRKARLFDQGQGTAGRLRYADAGGVMGGVFGSGSIADCIHALDARSNFEPIMQSVRDLNKLND